MFEQALHWWLLLISRRLIGNSEDTQNILIGAIWIGSSEHERQMKESKPWGIFFVVVVVVCGIVEAVANPRTNLAAQTIFYKIPNSFLWVILPWILSLEHNLETSEPCITSHVSAGSQNSLFPFNSQYQELRLELQGHKTTSKKSPKNPKKTQERGIYLESSTEKGLEIVELDSVRGALDVRLKQEQNPACVRGCLGSCTLNICSFQISEQRGCEESWI